MWIVIEVEPYGKRLQIENQWGEFPTEAAAHAFVAEYRAFHDASAEEAGECLLVRKLAGTDLVAHYRTVQLVARSTKAKDDDVLAALGEPVDRSEAATRAM